MGACGSASATDVKPLFHDTYKLGKKLGEGAFGQVRLAERKPAAVSSTAPGGSPQATKKLDENGTAASPQKNPDAKDGKVTFKHEFAVKVIDVRVSNEYGERKVDKDLLKSTRLEAAIWKQVGRHEHTVELFEAFLEQRLCYMVMERCQCTLMDNLVQNPTTQRADLVRVLREMLLGVQRCHEVRIIHRDVKPENFLYGGEDNKTVKICDFGLAVQMPKKGSLKGVCGTPPYMSPEMLKNCLYDYRTDVWSFGATVYLMLFGDFPYSPEEVSTEGMKRAIRLGYPEPCYKRAEDSAQTVRVGDQLEVAGEFVKSLLNRDPNTRPTCADALKLPFLDETPAKQEEIMEPCIRRARKVTTDFKMKTRKVDPTVQHDIDELLQKLQMRAHGHADLEGQTSMYFSEDDLDGANKMRSRTLDSDTMEDRIIVRRDFRHGTHSGTMSGTFSSSGSTLKSLDVNGKDGRSPLARNGVQPLPDRIKGRTSFTDIAEKKVDAIAENDISNIEDIKLEAT